jgi:alpha-mannosidase
MPAQTVLHVVPHTHWDREWYEPFEVYRFRLVKVVDRLLEILDADDGFCHFHFDGQTAAIEDYLEVRPAMEAEVAGRVREGRLSVGPWRILMDEFLCSAETLVRNLRQGSATTARLGGESRLGYIPDSFGHVAQMPQILRLAGITEACVWRGVPFAVDRTSFWWEAPDGSRIRTLYLATSYSNAASLPESFEDLMVRAKRIAADLEPFRPGRVLLAMNGTDHRAPEGHLPRLFEEANARQHEILYRIGSMREFLADAPGDDLPLWRGEMRSSARANVLMGVLSARMPLKQLEFRAATLLERYAEPLSAIAGTDTGSLLERAWRAMVENSAHDSICGCGVDAVAEQVAARYVEAARVADLVARDALDALGARVDASAVEGEGAIVFNPSPYPRGGIFEITLALGGAPGRVAFRAPDGRTLPAQALDVQEQVVVDMRIRGRELARIVSTIHARTMGTLFVNELDIVAGSPTMIRLALGPVPVGRFDVEGAKRRVEAEALARPKARFHVVATGPPLVRMLVQAPEIGGCGWSVLAPVEGRVGVEEAASADGAELRNDRLHVLVGPEGRIDLADATTGTRFPDVLRLVDGGDLGDEYNYSPPDRDLIVDRLTAIEHRVVSAGPLEARLRVTGRLRVPHAAAAGGRSRGRRLVGLPITMDLALRAGEPFLRVEVFIRNTARDHRLRAVVSLPFQAARSHADGAYHVAERGLDAEGAGHEHPLPTFPARRWVDVGNGRCAIAVLLRGTPEYELVGGRELAVTLLRCVGVLSRQQMRYRSGPAGPTLPTPGAQLPGDHHFELALHPHAGDWSSGLVAEAADAFSVPLRASGVRHQSGELPSEGAALAVTPRQVRVTAVQRREGAVEVRLFNAGENGVEAALAVGAPLEARTAQIVDLLGRPIRPMTASGGRVSLPLRAWEIATVRLD